MTRLFTVSLRNKGRTLAGCIAVEPAVVPSMAAILELMVVDTSNPKESTVLVLKTEDLPEIHALLTQVIDWYTKAED